MPALDCWVITTALQRYEALFGDHTKIAVTINLSHSSIGNKQVLTCIDEQLAATQVPAQRLCFEITESAVINAPDQAAKFFSALRERGCRVALEDVGSGYGSITYLKHFEVDYLKIDGALVRNLLESPIDCEFVRSINHISHLLGTQTIAEFVESSHIAERLSTLGIDWGSRLCDWRTAADGSSSAASRSENPRMRPMPTRSNR